MVGAVVSIIVAVVAVVGTITVARQNRRGTVEATGRTADVAAAQIQATRENDFIDQLQEELTEARLAQANRLERLEERVENLEKERDGYRDHAHVLEQHIFSGAQPPHPAWPTHLPR